MLGEVWEWAGTYRRTEKNIGIDPLHISVELRNLFDDVTFWIEQETYSPIEAATRMHHRLVYIHPFPNGNGRYARIMVDTLLTRIYKIKPIKWGGEDAFKSDSDRRRQYIDALRAADAGDYFPLFTFVGYKSSEN